MVKGVSERVELIREELYALDFIVFGINWKKKTRQKLTQYINVAGII